MGPTPSSAPQLILLVLVVLPGITYQFIRERWRGAVPGEQNLGERILRAIVASLVLDSLYLIVAGPELLNLVRGGQAGQGWRWDGLAERPRAIAMVAAALLVAIPASAAAVVSYLQRRRLKTTLLRTPTAWDHAFRDREAGFVRARLKDGHWVGGWYGGQSFASAYPREPELFLQRPWQMTADGVFVAKTEQSSGLYLRGDNVELLEFVDRPERKENQDEAQP
ncbi:DUF6338 family protein [Amycolatopsis sp. cmx-4-54]|uniref:DUF6338 family protein n=1 Tax=Amycolatopsis sp. cmx-4-54 TaxID=2790936 RepID=UPI00397937D2